MEMHGFNVFRSISVTNKAVLEPRVSPAFAITYFCNHCNIRFENTSKYVDTLTLFSKNLNQRSLTPRWLLTPCLLRSYVWLYPRIIVSESHDNTSMYVYTVINFAKYHKHTTYILHTYYVHTTYRMSDHIVSYWTQFRRDKNHMDPNFQVCRVGVRMCGLYNSGKMMVAMVTKHMLWTFNQSH